MNYTKEEALAAFELIDSTPEGVTDGAKDVIDGITRREDSLPIGFSRTMPDAWHRHTTARKVIRSFIYSLPDT